MGCQQSTPVAGGSSKNKHPIKGVGQTERMVSRAARVEQKLRLQQRQQQQSKAATATATAAINNSTTDASTTNSTGDPVVAKQQGLPKLDASGHLLPEEVVRRTQCSILTKTTTLGTVEHPIEVEVSTVEYTESYSNEL